MTVVNRVYITDELMKSFETMNIQNIDLAHNPMYNTSSMIYNEMHGSFYNNTNIVSVSNISNEITFMVGVDNLWDTGVFTNCTNLVNAPDLSNCNNLTYEQFTFKNCTNLVNAPIFPNSITSMSGTYQNTNIVNAPDLPISLVSMESIFSDCHNLTNASPIPSSMSKMYSSFWGCSSLVNAPDLSNCTNLDNMESCFFGCSNLVNAPEIPNSVTNMSRTFADCSSLINAPDMSNCTNLDNMYQTFMYCTNLTNAPVIPNSVTNMDSTFSECFNLVNASVIPNSVTNMSGTFSNCFILVNVPEISNSVTNMSRTFVQCFPLSGDITILSEEVKDASNCFQDTYINKTVLIPFNMSHSETYTKGYYWKTQSGKIVYTTTDFYSQCESNPNTWINEYNLKDENFGYLNGNIQYNPSGAEGEKYTINYEIEGTWYNETITYDSSKNVIITKSVGDTSFTYDSFVEAGYSTSERKDGVILKDLNDKGSLSFGGIIPSRDNGTDVYVDGILINQNVIELPSGVHEYKLVNPNYPVYYGSATVIKNDKVYVDINLTQITGHNITINTNVADCEVRFNGESATTVTSTQYTSELMYVESPMDINYSVEKTGYYTEGGVETFNNADIVLNVNLESKDIDLSNWNYSTDEFGNVTLEDYIGPDVTTLVIPQTRI